MNNFREVTFQAQCNDSHITQYFGSFLRGTELWISMEYVGGGSCLDYLKISPFTEIEAR